MESEVLVKFCIENGILLDKYSIDFFKSFNNLNLAYKLILKFKDDFNKNFINKDIILENIEYFKKVGKPLGLDEFSFNYFTDKGASLRKDDVENTPEEQYDILAKKVNINDFVEYFRFRFNVMKKYLEDKKEIKNLTSINKLSGNKDNVSILGLVYDKKITKNGNLLLEIEDLTGRVKVLLNKDIFLNLFDEVFLDSIIAVNGLGDKEIVFANELFFCDSDIKERKTSNIDESVVFIGDLHIGSKGFFEENFKEFVGFLNSDDEEAVKIKYMFISGDLVSGIGVYPNQELDLKIKNIKDQYIKAFELLDKVRKDIVIFIIPGNHDGVRLAEPQPKVNKKYAEKLYFMENIFLYNNPLNITIGKNEDFSGFNVLAYHGSSFIYYLNNISKFILEKTVQNPEKLMYCFLKNRHLSPTYYSNPCFMSNRDDLIIKTIPDIFISGHLHKSGVEYYNNILMVSCSSWESLNSYQKKLGLSPDFCKVPIFNLKTRKIEILDFLKNNEVKNGD